jgi:hypothetical protein
MLDLVNEALGVIMYTLREKPTSIFITALLDETVKCSAKKYIF